MFITDLNIFRNLFVQ